jgi:diguanylate cyclase (GGDEF)-like protein
MQSPLQQNKAPGTEGETDSEACLYSLPIPICRLLPDGTLTFYNQAFNNHFNEDSQNLAEGNFLILFPDEPRRIFENTFPSLSVANPIVSTLVTYITRDQITHWERWTLQGIFDRADQLVKIQALGYDLNIRELSVSAATQFAQQLSSLNAASQILLSKLDIEASLGQILDAAINAIPGGGKGALYLVTSSPGDIDIQNILDSILNDQRIRPFAYPGDSGYITRILRNRAPLRIDDLQPGDIITNTQDTQPVENLPHETSNSAIVAPLILGLQVLGAISLESTQKSAFTNADLHLLQNFASFATLAIHIFQLNTNLKQMEATDPLTKTYNRRGFQPLAEREIQRALRFDRPLSVVLVDIDNFKQANEEHGFVAGDKILQAVSEQISNNVRKIDVIGRYGGDEFILFLPETDLFGAAAVAERVRACIMSTPVLHENIQMQVTVSISVVKFIAKHENLDTLFKRAEEALGIAKKSGRNRIEIR